MNPSYFDKYATEYKSILNASTKASGEKSEFFSEYKIRDVFENFGDQLRPGARILDYGCGIGSSLPYFLKYFPAADINCIDVSEKSLEIARESHPEHTNFLSFDGTNLPFEDEFFDVVFAAGVFHHIPWSEHTKKLQEWRRVLKPGGVAIVFEHNPYNPMTRHAVASCPFDEDAQIIEAKALRRSADAAGLINGEVFYRLFFPRLLRHLRPLERHMRWLPVGAQYMFYAIKGTE